MTHLPTEGLMKDLDLRVGDRVEAIVGRVNYTCRREGLMTNDAKGWFRPFDFFFNTYRVIYRAPREPVPLKNMTDAEIAVIVRAGKDGRQCLIGSEWEDDEDEGVYPDIVYRLKPRRMSFEVDADGSAIQGTGVEI